MSRLTRDGTAELVSRDKILMREREQGKIHISVQLTTRRIGNLTRSIHCCCYCLHIKNRSDLYPVPFSFLLFKAKKRISVVTSSPKIRYRKITIT